MTSNFMIQSLIRNKKVQVKNLSGTSNDRPVGFDSWMDYYHHYIPSRFELCSACGSWGDIVGAHVYRTDGNRGRFIVPLCKGCNARRDAFMVYLNDLVPLQ